MTLEAILHHYGLLAVLAGAGIEGEAVVTTGGYLAGKGLFSPIAAAAAAAFGSCAADQFLFFLARWGGAGSRSERLRARPGVDRALAVIERHPKLFCVGFRFVYGFRVAGPVALGLSRVPTRLFVILNIASAGVWGSLFTWIGYRFGQRLEHTLFRIAHDPRAMVVGAAFALTLSLLLLVRHRAAARRAAGQSA